jgi:hypothetical protein
MSKKFKQKISKYINELESRGVIVVQEGDYMEDEDYTIYDVVYEYVMKCNDDEIYHIVHHADGHLEFTNAIEVDVLIIDDASDLSLLSNIQVTLDLSLVEDEDEPADNDRLKSVENQLDRLTQILLPISEKLDNLERKLLKLNTQQANYCLKFNKLQEEITGIQKHLVGSNVQSPIKSNITLKKSIDDLFGEGYYDSHQQLENSDHHQSEIKSKNSLTRYIDDLLELGIISAGKNCGRYFDGTSRIIHKVSDEYTLTHYSEINTFDVTELNYGADTLTLYGQNGAFGERYTNEDFETFFKESNYPLKFKLAN